MRIEIGQKFLLTCDECGFSKEAHRRDIAIDLAREHIEEYDERAHCYVNTTHEVTIAAVDVVTGELG